MKNKISVITPTYNRVHTLGRLYESLKKQVFKDFVWIVMDDGSTDDTRKLIQSFINEDQIKIKYYYHDNKHKLITVFEGIKKVETPYFTIIDSDDAYLPQSLQILYNEVSSIPNKDEFIAVMGHSNDPEGNLVGNLYPGDGFIGTIFDMRYKYKVRGDKNGIFITDTYLKELNNFNYNIFEGKGYIPQSVFYNTYDGKLKTKFINKVVRIYYKDESDPISLDNNLFSKDNSYGVRESFRSFINYYDKKLYLYPKVLIKNLMKYQVYTYLNKKPFTSLVNDLNNPIFKVLSLIIFPISYLYFILKKN